MTATQQRRYSIWWKMDSRLDADSKLARDEETIPAITAVATITMRQKAENLCFTGHFLVIALVNMLSSDYNNSPEDTAKLKRNLRDSLVLMKDFRKGVYIRRRNVVCHHFIRKLKSCVQDFVADGYCAPSVLPFDSDLQPTQHLETCYYIKRSLRNVCLRYGISDIPLEPSISHLSRLDREFMAIGKIGIGGCSMVMRAKNKLDGRFYAIKKIIVPVSEGNAIIKGLREIQILANLSHPNIVNYKDAWVRLVISEELDAFDSASSSSSLTRNTRGDRNTSTSPVIKPNESDNRAVVSRHSLIELPVVNSIGKPIMLEMYIKMELCSGTLQAWLNENRMGDRVRSDQLNILTQILKGTAFIHDNDIIHRDLKPENIFIANETLDVKIGDFGLSCVHDRNLSEGTRSRTKRHTQGVGTLGYISPEQKNGEIYDHKTDMYSIGVIAAELYLFYSKYELTKAIESLHREDDSFFTGQSPYLPRQVDVIKKLLSRDPQNRQDAHHLLQHDPLFYTNSDEDQCPCSSHILILQKALEDKNELLLQKDAEIAALKYELEKSRGRYRITESQP